MDQEWRFSPDDPISSDENGNVNNIIDTTNISLEEWRIGKVDNPSKISEFTPDVFL